MSGLKKYRKKATSLITAAQLNLETTGFSYQKWGAQQRCKAGDWLVENGGDCYTIDADTFDRTYERVSPGVYRKTSEVWAKVAQSAGSVTTREGSTAYLAGDYLVSNEADGSDNYAVDKTTFEAAYEVVANP